MSKASKENVAATLESMAMAVRSGQLTALKFSWVDGKIVLDTKAADRLTDSERPATLALSAA